MDRKRVGILVFDDVEVLDFCGPFEVFSATRLDSERRRDDASPFEIVLLAERARAVIAAGGLKVVPDCSLDASPSLDILLVPGGWGTRREIDNASLIGWIRETARGIETVCGVCTGSMLLGRAGLLDDRRATTHHSSIQWMRETFPDVLVVDDERVVVDGRIFTSAGISAGIDLALEVVARYLGDRIARETARHLEYPYPIANARPT